MIEIKVYRHKTEKEFYLTRNWSYCGGGPDTPFYAATNNVVEAISNNSRGKNFESWFHSFDGRLYAKVKMQKQIEFDGYKGTLEKEVRLYVKDFEPVILREVDCGRDDDE